ncbi:C40 family peptidase [Flavobacterium jejuense]|uniref:C40 family peptidase n=1 Tax=Flavobacterium jejuense TaxID=1544455 RepID=A0ABX0IPL1_9FLAO|nr:C40 family peptidase [Flavobacterium jejuense]NHN24739.1 C40 family peptidase [Flavobacterium jejuense]
MRVNFFIAITTTLLSFQCFNDSKVEKQKTKSTELELVGIQPEKETEEIVKIESSKEIVNREELVAFAKTFIDVPYVYATQDPKKGFDCSGFVNYVFKNFDIVVPRSSSGFKNFGKKIDVDAIALGDVLVFTGYQDSTSIGHLGIVCEADGFNSKFIHASSGKAMKVTISELNSAHYSKRFYKVVDVINK